MLFSSILAHSIERVNGRAAAASDANGGLAAGQLSSDLYRHLLDKHALAREGATELADLVPSVRRSSVRPEDSRGARQQGRSLWGRRKPANLS